MRQILKASLALLFAATVVSAPAFARDHHRDRGHDRHGYERDRHSDRDVSRYEARRRADGNYSRAHYQDRYFRSAPPRVVYRPVYRNDYHPGYGPPRWARGGRYYDAGYGRTYVVRDYRGYGLRAPPRGHYWRRSDAGDYLLVAVATGIIADLILRH
ncbi:MAG: hypothetical protein EOP91_12390 [Lysobacteraceae bacterium]|nr:MAG: hypothetical protein EOP91_12390 [Xanthomonadaceae bacterium]